MNRLSAMSEEEREYGLSMAVDAELPAAEDEIHDGFDDVFGRTDDAMMLWEQVVALPVVESLVRERAADNVLRRARGDDE